MPTSLWRNNAFRLVALCACAFASFYAAKHLKIVQMANAQVTAAPFFLHLTISQPVDGGTFVVFKTKTVARRSDGSTALIETVGPLSGGQTARKITFLDGRALSLIDALRVKSTWPARRPEEIALLKARLAGAHRDCVPSRSATLLAFEKLNGEDVAIIQSSDGGYRLTRWLAPRLGCEALRYRSEKLHEDGSATLAADARAVSFIPGEPDPRLFDLGNAYEEALPSTVQSRSLLQAGVEETEDLKDKARKLDEQYTRAR